MNATGQAEREANGFRPTSYTFPGHSYYGDDAAMSELLDHLRRGHGILRTPGIGRSDILGIRRIHRVAHST